MWPRLALNLWSFCLYLPSTKISDAYHHGWFRCWEKSYSMRQYTLKTEHNAHTSPQEYENQNKKKEPDRAGMGRKFTGSCWPRGLNDNRWQKRRGDRPKSRVKRPPLARHGAVHLWSQRWGSWVRRIRHWRPTWKAVSWGRNKGPSLNHYTNSVCCLNSYSCDLSNPNPSALICFLLH